MRTKQIISTVKVPNQELEGCCLATSLLIFPFSPTQSIIRSFLHFFFFFKPSFPTGQFCSKFTGNPAKFVWDFIGMLIREISFLPGTKGLKELSQIFWSVQLHLQACQQAWWQGFPARRGKQQGPETHRKTAGSLLMSLHKHPYCVTSWCFRHWLPVWVTPAHSSFSPQGPVFPAIVENQPLASFTVVLFGGLVR